LDGIRNTYAQIASKYQDILALEHSMAEIQQMLFDLALLTEQQEELLYQIDYQVIQANVFIKVGNDDLSKSIGYQKSILKKYWYVCIYSCCLVRFLAEC
jgi:t-SNARE complex subunit (syntaxin)